MLNCKDLKTKFEEIKDLKNELDLELGKIKIEEKNGKDNKEILEKAKQIRIDIEKGVRSIREILISKKSREIISREKEKLSEFFGRAIEVPPLSEEITIERIRKWEEQGFELHYLPEEDMAKEKDFPGWKKKPDNLFEYIKNGKVKPEVTKLEAGWVLIDGRAKPNYEEGMQMYDNDIFKEIIAKLREADIIAKWDGKDQGSRFNISNDELRKEEVLKALAEVLGVPAGGIRLPKAIEWNILGNLHYKEWGETNTSEWFDDEYSGGSRLLGGHSDRGGLLRVSDDSSGVRFARLGFRPLCRFDNK